MSLWLLSLVLTMGLVNAVEPDCTKTPISNCPFYNFQSDKVTPQDFQNKNVFGEHWLMIYYSQFDPHQSYGKCNFRWNSPVQNNELRGEFMCYNIDTNSCENFERKVSRKVDSCCRVEENTVEISMDAKFYSQDLSQYFWYDVCYNSTATGGCQVRYLDLLVRANRYPASKELDLQDLPWHLISADLRNNFNMDFSDPQMKFSWKGLDCGFDGVIKTTNGAETWRTSLAWIFIVTVTSLFL